METKRSGAERSRNPSSRSGEGGAADALPGFERSVLAERVQSGAERDARVAGNAVAKYRIRRWFQFGILDLLMLTTIVAAVVVLWRPPGTATYYEPLAEGTRPGQHWAGIRGHTGPVSAGDEQQSECVS